MQLIAGMLRVCLDVNQGGTETCHVACADLLMNPDSTPKTKSVWPTLAVKIARQKVDMNRHFQASCTSQPTGCLLILLFLVMDVLYYIYGKAAITLDAFTAISVVWRRCPSLAYRWISVTSWVVNSAAAAVAGRRDCPATSFVIHSKHTAWLETTGDRTRYIRVYWISRYPKKPGLIWLINVGRF